MFTSFYFWLTIFILVLVLYILRKYFRGPHWSEKKNQKGKIVVVTGSSAGIGKETAFDLLRNGATVIFACRDKKKTEEVINLLEDNLKKNAIFMQLDLCKIDSVYNFFDEFKSKFEKIDILVNNAGAINDTYTITPDGIESTLQGNHLSHMALTMLLLPYFDKKEGRIINVSSRAHKRSDYTVEGLKKLITNPEFEKSDPEYSFGKMFISYGNSKLANVYFSLYLANLLEKKFPQIKTASLHPGVVNTEFSRFVYNYSWYVKIFAFLILYPLFIFISKTNEDGAQTTLSLCYMDIEKIENGQYYADNARCELFPIGKDSAIKDEFIKYSWVLINKITKGKKEILNYSN